MSSTLIENEKVNESKNAIKNEIIETVSTESLDNEKFADSERQEEKNNANMNQKETGIEIQNGEVPSTNQEHKTKSENDEMSNNKETKDEWMDILGSGAIMKKIINEGKPETKPQRNEKCKINYTCQLEDEMIVDSASNFELYLGESDVISGLDVSIGLMNVEEKCILKIEPRLAFGKKGLPPKIPGDAVVIYDVELVSVEPEDDIEMLSIQQRKTIGNKKRERGNWWYSRGENNIAIQCYRRALDYLDEVEGGITGPLSERAQKTQVTDSDLQALLEDRVSVCNNMAAAQIKMEMFEAALNSLQIVLRCQPKNLKAHFRKAKVYIGKNDLPTAMKYLQKAKQLAPDDPEVQKEINVVSKLLDKQKARERELARRMFNGPKNLIVMIPPLKRPK